MLRLDLIFQYQGKVEPFQAAITPTTTARDRDHHVLGQKESQSIPFNPSIGGGNFQTST